MFFCRWPVHVALKGVCEVSSKALLVFGVNELGQPVLCQERKNAAGSVKVVHLRGPILSHFWGILLGPYLRRRLQFFAYWSMKGSVFGACMHLLAKEETMLCFHPKCAQYN